MLAFVLVNSLDLNVEQRFRIDRDAGSASHMAGQILLDGALDKTPFAVESRVLGVSFNLAQLLQVPHPVVTDDTAKEAREARISQSDPAPRSEEHTSELQS